MGREEMLKNVEIFSELGRRDLERVGKLMVPRQIRAGEVIIKEGDQAAALHHQPPHASGSQSRLRK